MWIVRIALDRPYTFIVLAILLPLLGALVVIGTPMKPGMATDIFPDIRIPVIGVVYNYTGLPPDEMSGRITSNFERPVTTIVNDVEHVESTAYPGVTVIKVFFQPGVDINLAMSQVTAFAQTTLRNMPSGVQPPLVLKYNASTVPILQLALSSVKLGESELFDFGNSFIRAQLATVAGASIPFPFGGAQRQVMVDLEPAKLRAQGLTPSDINTAIGNQNLIIPSGSQNPLAIDGPGDLPVRKVVNGTTITWRRRRRPRRQCAADQYRARRRRPLGADVGAEERLGLDAGDRRRRARQARRHEGAACPTALKVVPINDQSVFVRAAIKGVALEGAIAAALTSVMILLFLGSWRSTVIIAVSIPLSILGSIIALAATGETLNLMTLGGLALAVGILVDDATVTIENINWHLEQGKASSRRSWTAPQQIVAPALVSLLCICIVFIPMFFLRAWPASCSCRWPKAVIFAMVCSFILSRTLVPTMANWLLRAHKPHEEHRARRNAAAALPARLRGALRGPAPPLSRHPEGDGAPRPFLIGFIAVVALSFLLVPFLGSNFFPSVDSGQVLMHARVPVGTRVEETASASRDRKAIRKVIPPGEIVTMVDNIGLPSSSINLTYNNTGVIGTQDGDFQIALGEGHAPTADYVRKLRDVLPREFPDTTFSFPPADIVSQILNFGSPAPIDVQVRGEHRRQLRYANSCSSACARFPAWPTPASSSRTARRCSRSMSTAPRPSCSA
jgi:multidrug efflux pump subunit AcrB